MNLKSVFGLSALTIALLYAACSDPTIVGAGLLDEDRADIGFTDTFTLRADTELSEPLLTYSPFASLQLDRFLFGKMNDPVFGRSAAAINMQFLPSGTPVFEDLNSIDSVVLVLPYTLSAFYGKTEGEPFSMGIFNLQELLDEDAEYESGRKAAFDPMPLTDYAFTATQDSLEYVDYLGTEPDTTSFPHLRVPLPLSFADSLVSHFFADSMAYTDTDIFLSAFPGFHLESTSENEGMLGITLLSVRAGIHLYYRDSSDTPRRQLYNFNSPDVVQYAEFEHDFTGTPVADAVANGVADDEVFYVQGMAGARGKMKLPDLSSLSDVAINQAELDVYVADLEEGDTTFEHAMQLVLLTTDSDGEEVFIDDVIVADSRNLQLAEFFGGVPETNEEGVLHYRMSISNYVQMVIEGEASDEFYFIPIFNNDVSEVKRAETAERATLCGGSHPEYPATLRVTFTRL